MKVLDNKGLSGFMELLVTVMFIVECAGAVFLPWLLKWLFGIYTFMGRISINGYGILLGLLYFTLAFGLPFTWDVRGILRNINAKKPFIADNVKRLNRLSVFAAILAAGYLAAFFIVWSFFIPLLFMLFAVMSLFLAVCAALFKQAVMFKEENELTI